MSRQYMIAIPVTHVTLLMGLTFLGVSTDILLGVVATIAATWMAIGVAKIFDTTPPQHMRQQTNGRKQS